MLDTAEEKAIREVLRRDATDGFLNKFERDLLEQILRRHTNLGAATATTEDAQE
jgi:hypothetical protein